MGRKVFVSSDMAVDERLIAVAEQEPLAALLWPWLLTGFDDWGRLKADPRRLKASLFPANQAVGPELLAETLRLCDEAGLLHLYEVDGQSYASIEPAKWFQYQTHIRQEKRDKDGSKCPPPPERNHGFDADGAQLREDARICTPSPTPSTLPPSHPTPTSLPAPVATGVNYSPEFERFWLEYPRKVGKGDAFAKWRARMREGTDPETLAEAARNYAGQCRAKGTGSEYIKHPATFLSDKRPFEDYLKPPAFGLVDQEFVLTDREFGVR